MNALYLILVALMCMTAIGLIWPLLRRPSLSAPDGREDVQVYKDQLAGIEQDLAHGVLVPAQAESLRVEVQRRLLAAAAQESRPVRPLGRGPLVVLIALLLPLGSLLLYALLGSPLVPDLSYRARLAERAGVSQAEADRLYEEIQTLTNALQAVPDDAALWRKVGDLNRHLTRFDMAAEAYRNALRNGGQPLDTLVSFGEMLVWSNPKGVVMPDAQEIFELALKRDPNDVRARYYQALAQAQGGDIAGALERWQQLEGLLPATSPMRPMVRDDIRKARDVLGLGPDETDIANWEAVERMLATLVDKLAKNPDNRDDWLMLGRAYAAMDRKAEAKDALQRALALTPAVSEEYRQIEEMLKALKTGQ